MKVATVRIPMRNLGGNGYLGITSAGELTVAFDEARVSPPFQVGLDTVYRVCHGLDIEQRRLAGVWMRKGRHYAGGHPIECMMVQLRDPVGGSDLMVVGTAELSAAVDFLWRSDLETRIHDYLNRDRAVGIHDQEIPQFL